MKSLINAKKKKVDKCLGLEIESEGLMEKSKYIYQERIYDYWK